MFGEGDGLRGGGTRPDQRREDPCNEALRLDIIVHQVGDDHGYLQCRGGVSVRRALLSITGLFARALLVGIPRRPLLLPLW